MAAYVGVQVAPFATVVPIARVGTSRFPVHIVVPTMAAAGLFIRPASAVGTVFFAAPSPVSPR